MMTSKTRDKKQTDKNLKTLTYPSGLHMMVMCRLHTWLSLQRWWKDFARFQENMKAFVHGLTFVIDEWTFNQLCSGEVTLQNVLPSDSCMVSRRKAEKTLSGHARKILSLYLLALTLYPADNVYKDLKEDMKLKGFLHCSVFFTCSSIVSGYQHFETGKSYFWNIVFCFTYDWGVWTVTLVIISLINWIWTV